MATKNSKKPKQPIEETPEPQKKVMPRIVLGLFVVLLGLTAGLGFFNVGGSVGLFIFTQLGYLVGSIPSLILSVLLLIIGFHILFNKTTKWFSFKRDISALLLFASLLGILGMLPLNGGGILGAKLSNLLIGFFDVFLASLLLLIVFGLSLWILFQEQISAIYHFFESRTSHNKTNEEGGVEDESGTIKVVTADGIERITLSDDSSEQQSNQEIPQKEKDKKFEGTIVDKSQTGSKTEADVLGIDEQVFSESYSNYTFPPLSLLKISSGKPNVGDLKENARVIQRTLKNFGVDVEMDEITVGPTVTRYALKPAEGVHLKAITNLQNNLELALASYPVRIEAPIPGKSLVGIEIPNKKKVPVFLGNMLTDKMFRENTLPLWISLGKGVSGETHFDDLAKTPHLLIAGSTGSGKSVTVHNLILSLLFRNSPETLRLIMIDPKRVELTLYNNIPHLLTPVIKDAKKAIIAMKWAVKEMERRYNILEEFKTQNINSYHAKIKNSNQEGDHAPEKMPYIVIFIDELADLMQLYPRELEASIVRLAQMSRAVGIHLVLSTQRPSKQIVTGLIKANIPTRIALRVTSNIDSRVILDTSGAELLIGQGDMLFSGGNSHTPVRMQCAYVSEEEVKKIVKFIISNNEDILPNEIELPESIDSDRTVAGGNIHDGDDDDDLYEEARETVIGAGKASTSFLQRKFRIGYSRAARLMDILEAKGVIGAADGAKPRDILDSKGVEKKGYGDENYDTD